ncbi:glycosyltransferase family 8 protein [Halosquirtibacter xylanolyticus]|uniref:glycosyltransferase family 8 protein n=1 Tax=Halosquirtibacter xylanolyticus TaxID=3374599 RepID=UPI003749C3F0|nr:glycosyltransferase family 8 protein [Prolixibacteraceae bacterium]
MMSLRSNVPIVLSFDDQMALPAGVCITSLLDCAKVNTIYDIYILCNDNLSDVSRKYLLRLCDVYDRLTINFVDCGDQFKASFEVRDISVAAYYRLLIPSLLPQLNKAIYSDVDVIFRDDLSELYHTIDLENNYLAGVKAAFLSSENLAYLDRLGLDHYSYINSGFLVFNCSLIRHDCIENQFLEFSKKDLNFQDQDIVNLVCKDRIRYISPRYTFVQSNYMNSFDIDMLSPIYSKSEIEEARNIGIVHYNGPKPWNELCPRYDIWWNCYRNSIYYDEKDAINMEMKILNNKKAIDNLLIKLIRRVITYFNR